MFEIRVHGLGGQGAVTLVNWVAQAGYAVDEHVQAFPFFGAERRGAPVKAFVRIDDNPINLRSQVYRPDLLVIMSSDLTGMAIADGLTPDGKVLLNAGPELAERLAARFSREMLYLDATGIALELGLEFDGMPMVNLPLLGAMTRLSGAAPLDVVLGIVREVAGRRGNVEAYESAVRQGWEGIQVVEAGMSAPVSEGATDYDLSRSGVTPIEP
ncbi:MAG: 2-oxoacid:acceptor oxidoreductase family protein [Actinobacteria bacterium]|nr:2-oxoacid:acceptor oxidoreductase family protein [Actinomycetota bacterium]MBU2686880.1 2-oxoacid:acceptor oxidoreductase family protein [Actinomycetota bacterium]